MVKHRRFMDAVFEHILLNGAKTVGDLVCDVQIVQRRNRRRRYLNGPSRMQLARLIAIDSRFIQLKQGNNASLWSIDEEYLQTVKKEENED